MRRSTEIKEYNDRWRADNDNYFKTYRQDNRISRNEYNKKWRAENPDKAKKHAVDDYIKNRTTTKGRLSASIKSGILGSIRKGSKRKRAWELLVGYEVEQLKLHLEQQFTVGMSWDNYGAWHIDHIIPISAHNYETPDDIDFHRCWSLNNLRPLWALENIIKSNKLDEPFQPSLGLRIPDNDNIPATKNVKTS